MKPYILKYTKQASEKGTPIMRPMFFDFYEDERCYNISDQYMFGEDILFAPVYRQGETVRSVYLPEGKWIRTLDRKEYDGGQSVECSAEIDEFIAFVKKGAQVIDIF